MALLMKGVIGVGSWKARFCSRYVKCSVSCLHANWNGRWWLSCSVTSNSLRPHGLQHTRPPCPSLSPRVCSNSRPLSWGCRPTISSSVTLFSSCPQFLPASGSFLMSQLFTSDGQNIRALVSASVLTMNIQGWFPLGLTGLTGISLCYYWNSFRQMNIPCFHFFILNFLQVSFESLGNLWLWLPYFLLCFLAFCISLSPKSS